MRIKSQLLSLTRRKMRVNIPLDTFRITFLYHTLLDLMNERTHVIRQALGRRRTLFQGLEASLRNFVFDNWDDVFSFVFHGLELDPG